MAAIMCDDGTSIGAKSKQPCFAYPRLCRQESIGGFARQVLCLGTAVPIVFDDFPDAGASRWSIENAL